MTLKRKIPRKNKKLYKIDGLVYESKTLFEFHQECKDAVEKKFIETFEVPNVLSKKSRYITYKPIVDEIKFDSMMEARYYLKLKKDVKEKQIIRFEMQVPFTIQPKFKKNGKTIRAIEYVADFVVYKNDGTKDVIDIKGKETVEFKLKHKLFEYKYSDLSLLVIQYYEPECKWLTLDEIKKLNKKSKKKTT
jgi:hypothetical protein